MRMFLIRMFNSLTYLGFYSYVYSLDVAKKICGRYVTRKVTYALQRSAYGEV